jgi:hypothetical protein
MAGRIHAPRPDLAHPRTSDTKGGVRLSLLTAFASALALFVACRENPSLSGSRVAAVSNPTCPQACDRLKSLCGYPPVDCVKSCEDGYDDAHRACIGTAASCQDALESCATEESDGGDEAGGDPDAGTEAPDADDAALTD